MRRLQVRNTSAWTNGEVAYSYETPIAVRSGGEWIVSDRRYSATTSRQTRELAPGARVVPHEEFCRLLPEEARDHGRRNGRL